jgi:hypothetical protein
MTFLRRFLVLVAFAFWQGGFTFYAAVVVPVGREIDPSFSEITTRVTTWLNLTGGVALAVLALDLLPRDPAGWRRWLRAAAWAAMVLMQGALVWLHVELDRDFSRPYHKLYLWTHTAQWACGLAYLALMVLAWRGQDRQKT